PIKKHCSTSALRLVVFSDYRVQNIFLLADFIKRLERKPDLLLYAGDDVDRFQEDSKNAFESLASLATYGLCAVIGNDLVVPGEGNVYRPENVLENLIAARYFVRGKDVYEVHEQPLVTGDYAVIGNEGMEVFYPERLVLKHLRLAAKAVKGRRIILISHLPPLRTLDLGLRYGRGHKGSGVLRNFILKRKDVFLVVCGHIHFCGAQSKKLGRSLVVNAASHDDFGSPGRIGIIDLEDDKIAKVEWRLLWELVSIPGIGDSREAMLLEAGNCGSCDFAKASEGRVAWILKCGMGKAALFCARARALCKQEMIVVKSLLLSPEKRAYLDIETDLAGTLIWLIGIYVEDENKTYSFFAETPDGEKKILSEMLQFFEERSELNILSFSGTRFEERLFKKRLGAHGLSQVVTERIKDLYFEIHDAVAFPCQGLGLKNIAEFCGFKWRDEGMSGFSLALMYGGSGKSVRPTAIRYNEDDLLSLKHVVDHIEKLCREKALAAKA